MPAERKTSAAIKGIMKELKTLSDPEAVKGMARFGINPKDTYGVAVPELRRIAKGHRGDHDLAAELWSTGVHEARILASMVDDPKAVTESQMEAWVKEFDSWDVCDQCCMNLFDKTPFAVKKVEQWAGREDEFVKRAGFALIACLAWHDKDMDDSVFEDLLPLIVRGSTDTRNYVKKAVNWALRQIGKRNLALNGKAVETAKRIHEINSKSAKWIAADALRELTRESTLRRIEH